jgi:hypothetical protein
VPIGFYELTGVVRPVDKREKGVATTFHAQANVRVKINSPESPLAVANEYICAELAKHIRLPLPPHFLAKIKRTEHPAFCMMDANMKGTRLPAIDPVQAVADEPDICTGVLLFDIWVGNDDRHLRNISYQAERPPHKISIFDHDRAPFFYTDFARRNRYGLGIIRPDGMRHCLLDRVDTIDYFDKWINRIKGVRSEYIEEILTDAVQLGLPDTVRVVGYDYLLHRRNNIDHFVRDCQSEFTGIAQWGLLWGT